MSEFNENNTEARTLPEEVDVDGVLGSLATAVNGVLLKLQDGQLVEVVPASPGESSQASVD